MSKKSAKNRRDKNKSTEYKIATEEETAPDWSRECEACGETPIVPLTGMCGPCTFGEAETVGGNW